MGKVLVILEVSSAFGNFCSVHVSVQSYPYLMPLLRFFIKRNLLKGWASNHSLEKTIAFGGISSFSPKRIVFISLNGCSSFAKELDSGSAPISTKLKSSGLRSSNSEIQDSIRSFPHKGFERLADV